MEKISKQSKNTNDKDTNMLYVVLPTDHISKKPNNNNNNEYIRLRERERGGERGRGREEG